ncbi:MAG: ADP-ribosylglycohydrolase family protein [Bradymonadales bacterium]|nr:ADP-ribosylglycohydrolase family protein [Bradymonadales bacterium]
MPQLTQTSPIDLVIERQQHGQIAVAESWQQLPEPADIRPSWDRVEGMLLGLAIGDALGNTTESMNPRERKLWFGNVQDYLPNPYAYDRCVGLPSDDTQLTFWTLEVILEHGRLEYSALAKAFAADYLFGCGRTMRRFLEAYESGKELWSCGQPRAGNGALMRIAPVLIPHLASPSQALWADTLLAASLTHNDFTSNGSCVGLVSLLWDLLVSSSTPEPGWWIERFAHNCRLVEGEALLHSGVPTGSYSGPLWRFVEQQVTEALVENRSALEVATRWRSGAYLLEAVPTLLFILARHAHDPEQAILHAVNETWDNDTIAACVGAAVGALHGSSALPDRWKKGLLGRTRADDDGRVFELLDQLRGWLSARGALHHSTPAV